jgi:hypothetical protein
MSALGHKQTVRSAIVMSALPPKVDMCSATRYVRFVPTADIWSRDCKPRIFAQPTPNQISQKKIVTIDIPVDMTITDDTVLKYTLYC